ncbi:MAG: hypothetical protein K2Y20_08585 [Sphingomonas sp.]|nr:hypothetical protein [Sphingomonas sp.]
MIRSFCAFFAILLLAAPTAAQEKPEPEVRSFNKKAVVNVDPKSGYIYFDNYFAGRVVLVRLPDDAARAERDAKRVEARAKFSDGKLVAALRRIDYESRQKRTVVVDVRSFVPDARDEEGRKWFGILTKLPAGRYVIVGYDEFEYFWPSLCLCLGTVMFDAVPGKIVDLGQMRSYRIEREGLGKKSASSIAGLTPGRGGLTSFYIAPRAKPPVLPRIGDTAVVPAQYYAVGRLSNATSSEIDRVTAIEGVIRYEPGKVIDARTNQAAEPLDL